MGSHPAVSDPTTSMMNAMGAHKGDTEQILAQTD